MARLAQKGKGKKVRFKGGTLFPAVVVGVAVIGAALIVYSRASIPDRNVPPTVNDHWHASYGFYGCNEWLPDLQGNKEELDTTGNLANDKFRRTGIHSHDDGVKLAAPIIHTLETAIEWIGDDELVEVTPTKIRIRKRMLGLEDRRRAFKKQNS